MSSQTASLENATIVIVGASSGFGRGAALALAQKGAKVVVAARRTGLLDELVNEIHAAGGKALAVTADVSQPEDLQALAHRTLEEFGLINIWINNVGVGAIGYLWEIPIEVHARLVDVNLKGLIYGAHIALRQFISQGHGILINVGSVDSEVPIALQNTYAATKAGVLSLGRSLNEELRLSGHSDTIKVATIMPWAIDTPWWAHAANYSGHAPRMAAMDDPQKVVEAIVKACTHPKEEMPVGAKARVADIFHHIFPGFTERMTANTAQRETNKGTEVAHSSGSLFTPMEEGRTVEGGVRERKSQEDS